MATFDQKHQTVTHQYNADLINFDGVSDRGELVKQLELLKSELERLKQQGGTASTALGEAAADVERAAAAATKPDAAKGPIVSALEKAGKVLEGTAGIAELVAVIGKAAKLAALVL